MATIYENTGSCLKVSGQTGQVGFALEVLKCLSGGWKKPVRIHAVHQHVPQSQISFNNVVSPLILQARLIYINIYKINKKLSAI